MKTFTKLTVALLGMLAMSAARAEYPADKPITVVVPFSAGGPTDKVARELAQVMSKHLKQQMIVDNTGGAGGTIGAKKVVNAAKDGYTVLVHHIGMSTAPALYKNLGFDPMSAYEFVGQIADVPMVLIANKALPPNTYKELVPYLKANASKIAMANAGIGSASHLCGLMFMSAIEQDFTTVPYKGTAPALTDLIGGQVQLMCDQTTNIAGQLSAKQVKPYGATTTQRIAAFKDIPTLSEQGLKDFEVKIWHAMYAPKGTPKPVIDKLSAALQASVQDTMFKAKMFALGAEVVPPSKATPDDLRRHLKAEIDKWSPVIKKAGIYAD